MAGLLLAVSSLSGVFVTACLRQAEVGGDRSPGNYYQTGFFTGVTSEALEEAFRSVKQIHTRVFYDTYIFSSDGAPLAGELGSPAVLERAVDTVFASHERTASAIALAEGNRGVALVTVAHALAFADTLVEFFDEDPADPPLPPEGRRIESISLKAQQTNWVTDPGDVHPFQILARDDVRDLALIAVQLPESSRAGVPPLGLTLGDSDRLGWGSFVYVLGYPRTYPMITRGIVSAPGHPALDSFLVDGLWNRGMSGGLILAVRGENERLEWVGMARAAVGSSQPRLVPEDGALENRDLRLPYDGPIFLEEVRAIDYGITLSVAMTDIRQFLTEHRALLAEHGYDMRPF